MICDQPSRPIREPGWKQRNVAVIVTPKVDGFVNCVVRLKDPIFDDLTLEADVELITLRDSQVSLNGSQRVASART